MAVQRLNVLVDNKKKILNSFSIIQKVANHYQSRLWTVFSKSLLCSVIPDDDQNARAHKREFEKIMVLYSVLDECQPVCPPRP